MPAPIPFTKTAQKNTFGGFQTATIYSGGPGPSLVSCPGAVAAGGDTLLCSGAGRLDGILLLPPAHSGLVNQTLFYDGAVATSGGPFNASGHKIIGIIPPFVNVVSGNPPISGNQSVVALGNIAGDPKTPCFPFQSGLCVHTASGCTGFTVMWTPEIAGQ